MRKFLLSIVALVAFTVVANAQSRTISGKVTDEKGQPMSGVTIIIRGTVNGTTTKADGTYSINAEGNSTVLVFSALDMTTQSLTVGNRKTINVTMASASKELDQVVVTGYTREKKSQFTGSATVLSSKVVETVPVGAFDQALQGRVPGMVVNSGSGQPGRSANITIRGIQSISGAGVQPLYVLDGIPIPAGDMATLNPNDFESITLLKDAGAAAQYGARGGLGVVVITTKKGKAGTTNFTFRTQVGFTQAPNPSNFNMMTSAEALAYEEAAGLAYINAGSPANTILGPGWINSKKNPSYALQTPAVQARRDFLLDSLRNNNLNYYDILFRQGFSQTHEINVSGGNEKTRFFFSGGMFDQKGTDLNSRLRRYTSRFNLDHTVGKLNVQFNTTVGYSISNYNEGEWRGNSPLTPFQIVWRAKPYENPYRPDGSIIFAINNAAAPTVIGNTLDNGKSSYWQNRQIKINAGLTLSYKLFPTVTLRNTFGIDNANDLGIRAINANSFQGTLQTGNNGFLTEGVQNNANLINTSSVIFNKRFNSKHDVEAGAYFEVVRGFGKTLGYSLFNLDPRLTLTGQGAGLQPTNNPGATSAKSGFGIRSYFGTFRYTFNNKYTLTANARRDGTSRIVNKSNREINTWSAGLSWDAMRESFMKGQKVVTDLRLKASYGAVPNIGSIAIAGYNLQSGLFGITNYQGPQLPTFATSTAFLASSVAGLVPNTPGNPELKIETITKLNVGAELGLWKNRARFVVDVYKNTTEDLFVSVPLGATTGFGGTSLPINAGRMSNRGVELTMNVDVIKTKNVDVTLGFNHAINNNKIEDLGPVQEYPQGTGIIRKGAPFGTHYAIGYLGADPATGSPLYKKLDGTTTTNVQQAGQFADYGTYLPKHVGGFTADVRINRVTISALFSYQFDVYRYNNVESWTTRGGSGFINAVNQNRILLTEQWQKPGDNKFYAKITDDRQFTSADVHDAKFLRFRNLNLSYALPNISAKGKSIIKSARLYVQAQNLWIWSPWRGLDPEDSNNISLNEFPNPRAVVAGIDINF
jgi:TonB-linked SusC/RagA family outer membrane protein